MPLVLQQRARSALRSHMRRHFIRLGVLLAADLGLLAGVHELMRGVGTSGWLGQLALHFTRSLLPRGTYPAAEMMVAVLLGLLVFGNYGSGDRRRHPPMLVAGTALGLGLVFWSRMWREPSPLLALGFLLAGGSLAFLVVIERQVIDAITERVRHSSRHAASVLLVGSAPEVEELRRQQALRTTPGFRIRGFVDVNPYPAPNALGGLPDLVRVIEEERVDTVILVGQLAPELFVQLTDIVDSAGCQVFALPRHFALGDYEPRIVWRRGLPLVQITRPTLRGQQLILKRVFDIGAAGLGLLIASPLFVLLAVAVRASSKGPIFFRQERVGRGGKPFFIYKFRSMVRDAESKRAELSAQSIYGDDRLFKLRNDPRVTRVGRFLRRTSLDELPQLWNVLRGEMSLVGPRPPIPREVAAYEEHHYTRFEMRPGITGPWQVSGRNNITDFDRVVELEREYSRQWTIWRDFEILARTVPVVLKMDGAH